MKVEVLVSTVNCDPRELIKKMNIQTDAIIINQCDKNEYEEIMIKDYMIKVYSFNERGVGLSRNTALMRASGDIVLFADDDEVLEDNYSNKIILEFELNKKNDFIIFSVGSFGGERKAQIINKSKKIHFYNCLRYGAVRFAVRREFLIKNNITFSLLFGGGAKYGSGEDSIFMYDCLKNKAKIITSPVKIADVDFSESSWFKGYNQKYYFDKGALFYHLNHKFPYFLSVMYILKHRNEKCEFSNYEKFKMMKSGIKQERGVSK